MNLSVIRMIDGQPFVVQRVGKRESLLTPTEAIAAAFVQVAATECRRGELAEQESILQVELETAVLEGRATTEIRSKIMALRAELAEANSTIAGQRRIIQSVHDAVRKIEFDRIKLAHAERIAALIAPFQKNLEESKICPTN